MMDPYSFFYMFVKSICENPVHSSCLFNVLFYAVREAFELSEMDYTE